MENDIDYEDIFEIKFFPITLNFWKDNIDYLFSLKEQLLNAKFGFSQQKEDAIQRYSERIKNDFKNQYDHELDLSDELYHIDKIYPEIVYNSMFIYAYSYFEISLKKLVNIIDDHVINKKENPNINNIGGSYIEKSKLYIEKTTGIDLSEKATLWDTINKKRVVRNAIVHNASNAGNNHDLCNFLKNNDDFVFDDKRKDFYIKKSEFVFQFVEECEEYLYFIYEKLDKLESNMYN